MGPGPSGLNDSTWFSNSFMGTASRYHNAFGGMSQSQKTRKYRHIAYHENKALLLLKSINVHIK